MLVLLGIGFLAGVVTSLSPCVLPVLPILLAGSAAGPPRRPYAIVAGLVASFSLATLFAAWLLDLAGLPQDLLRDLAIALLFLVAATLVFPRLGELVARPLQRLARRPGGDLGGGFLLGASLGLVFVPCAGPVLAAVAVLAANREVGTDALLLTFSYGAGAGLPMLALAVGGRRAAERSRGVRAHAAAVRRTLGAVIGATALAIALGLDRPFQTAIPGYTEAFQERVEDGGRARRELSRLTGLGDAQASPMPGDGGELPDLGAAPEVRGIAQWLNTPGERPLSIAGLRGNVVLVDFWTYSCINCLRTLPHRKAWDRAYRDKGLVILGVHTPEFAFEREESNVRTAVERLGVRYPVALDNDYGTWNAYENRYWPAEYLIDRRGRLRYTHFGEGEYEETERLIRELLAQTELPEPTRLADRTPRIQRTPETYLGYERAERHAGTAFAPDRMIRYAPPGNLYRDEFALVGNWRVERERSVAGTGARLVLGFQAREVFLVLSGRGTVRVLLNGRAVRTVKVATPRLYTLVRQVAAQPGVLDLHFSPGVAAYAFTFG